MAHINLLPWREERRKQKQQQFTAISAGTAVVGLLLVGEGIAILLWAFATQVRRRLVVGLGAITSAIFITVGILLANEFSKEGGEGTLLIIGIVAAVLLILIGSMLEMWKARVGRTVKRVTTALEEWE